MASTDAMDAQAIYYAELLAAKVVEGVGTFPDIGDGERWAMLELVAAKLTEAVDAAEAYRASG